MKTKLTTMLLAVAMLPALGHAQTVNICDRTPQVRDAITETLGTHGRSQDCALASSYILGGMGHLFLHSKGITALKAGDFAGLTSLNALNLEDNRLATLPEDLFAGRGARPLKNQAVASPAITQSPEKPLARCALQRTATLS